jgi:hypothetical protein
LCYNARFTEGQAKESNIMNEGMGTGDIIIGIVAALGVLVLLVVFVVVVKKVLLHNDGDNE